MSSKERIIRDWQQSTNMSPIELGAWLRTDIAPVTVANNRHSPSLEQSQKVLRLLTKPINTLNPTDCEFLRIMLLRLKWLKNNRKRMHGLEIDWENSLRNLGYDIRKDITVTP